MTAYNPTYVNANIAGSASDSAYLVLGDAEGSATLSGVASFAASGQISQSATFAGIATFSAAVSPSATFTAYGSFQATPETQVLPGVEIVAPTLVEAAVDTSFMDQILHCETGETELVEQYKNSENLKTLLCIPLTRFDGVEDVVYDILTQTGIDNAVGDQLDELGALVGRIRTTADDEQYRLRIKARILANISAGTVENMIDILSLLTSIDVVVVEDGKASATIKIKAGPLTNAEAKVAGEFILDAKPLGVEIVLTWHAQDRTQFKTAVNGFLSQDLTIGAGVMRLDNIPSQLPEGGGSLIINQGLPTEEVVGFRGYNAAGVLLSGTLSSYYHYTGENVSLVREHYGLNTVIPFYPPTEFSLYDALTVSGTTSDLHMWAVTEQSPLRDTIGTENLPATGPGTPTYKASVKGGGTKAVYLPNDAGFLSDDSSVGNYDANDNFAVFWAGAPVTVDDTETTLISKFTSGNAGWKMVSASGGEYVRFDIYDGSTTHSCNITDYPHRDNNVHCLMATVNRDDDVLNFFAWSEGTAVSGTEVDITGLGSLESGSAYVRVGGDTSASGTQGYHLLGSCFEGDIVPSLGPAQLQNFVDYTALNRVTTISGGTTVSALTVKSRSRDNLDRSSVDLYQDMTQSNIIKPNEYSVRYPTLTELDRLSGLSFDGLWYTETATCNSESGNTSHNLSSTGAVSTEYQDYLGSFSAVFAAEGSAFMSTNNSTYFDATEQFVDIWVGRISESGSSTDPTSNDDTLRVFGKGDCRQILCGSNFIKACVGEDSVYITADSGQDFFDGSPIIISITYSATDFKIFAWHRGKVSTSADFVPTATLSSLPDVFSVGGWSPVGSCGMNSTMFATVVDKDISSFDIKDVSRLASFMLFQ